MWAFEKLVAGVPANEVTGVVTTQLWQTMLDPVPITPRRSSHDANHTEVYLPEQVLIVFHRDVAVLISHLSSGDGGDWCEHVTVDPDTLGNPPNSTSIERDMCGLSVTPGGVFRYYRRDAGPVNTELGELWDPVYFNYSLAVHGADDVSPTPASRGTIRIPRHTADLFQDAVAVGERIYIWDGTNEPEDLGAPAPRFPWPDPNPRDRSVPTTS